MPHQLPRPVTAAERPAGLRFRPASPDDATSIADLWHEGWHDAHAAIVPAELVRQRSRESFGIRTARHLPRTTVAERDGTILGFFMLKGDELYQFYVSRAARGSGLAARLMREAEQALAHAGHARAWLACTIGNTRAARFYERAGWASTGAVIEPVETLEGSFPVEVWRFEKDLA